MTRQSKLPFVCFAPDGEPHSNCQNEPFQSDGAHHSDSQSKIWIGFRNDQNASYNGCMTFGQVLAQAETNLTQASRATSKRAEWLEAFPGVSLKATLSTLDQFERGERGLKEAYCQHSACTKRREPSQMEWIPVEYDAPGSSTREQGFIVGYLFTLRGHEMIAICRNYYFAIYRFQREDGSVSPDMALATLRNKKQSKPKTSKAKIGRGPNTVLDGDKSLRRSRRRPGRGSPEDEDMATHPPEDEDMATHSPEDEDMATHSPDNDEDMAGGFAAEEPPTITPDGLEGQNVEASPAASMTQDIDTLTGSLHRVAQAHSFFAPGSTSDEYEAIIVQIIHTYGVEVLTAPNIIAHAEILDQALREDNRPALCQAFGKLHTVLVKSANTAADSLDDEYENMISAAVLDYGMKVLATVEGTTFTETMREAMIGGDRAGLCNAYAALRACMAAYAGHSEVESED